MVFKVVYIGLYCKEIQNSSFEESDFDRKDISLQESGIFDHEADFNSNKSIVDIDHFPTNCPKHHKK